MTKRKVSSARRSKKPHPQSTRRQLSDEDLMPFGTHVDKPLGKVPDSYWKWFLRQPWSKQFPDLVEYAKVVEED